ncbi:glycosyltransferase family 1 protein [Bacillus timonensis]|uniref:Glycosyltransferase family 1 protein n=1 Tax=Bacillus timonensis TaxID=1033734 RepID=A0A4S3PJJ5_9BACI|nr:glycosyltransferase [Bacillus timonensis]THE09244.1 glycosyltransferase family 1 protein [Bacillus timonensis]
MKDNENQIINNIKTGDFQKALELFNDKNLQTNSPKYYATRSCENLQNGKLQNAWLWSWRGLNKFPKDPILTRIIEKICELNSVREKSKQTYNLNFEDNETHGEVGNSNTNIRVLQGSMEIANQMNTLSEGLNRQGIIAHTINYYPYYLNYDSNYTWSLIGQRSTPLINEKLRKLTNEFLHHYDLFHFHFGTSLTLDWSDLPLYKSSGKAILMQHWGSDVRIFSKAIELNPYALVKNKNEYQIKTKLSKLSDNIHNCVVFDMELYQYVKEFYKNVHVLPSMINLKKYQPIKNAIPNKKPLIVHAPTSPAIKGTKYILEAIESLNDKYDFDFRLVKGLSHDEAIKIYQAADLIIDQLHIGSYGLFAVEAMAMGKPVICWISDFMKDHYPNNLPIIIANPETIKDTIEFILRNIDLLPEIGIKGRQYVEMNHDMVKNSKDVLSLYLSLLQK